MRFGKRIFCLILCAAMLGIFGIPALAADSGEAYTLKVNDAVLDTSDLPRPPYSEGDTVMVPLRKTAEALGYEVEWVSQTREIRVGDSIQTAVLRGGSQTVNFIGKLRVIDLSREVSLDEKAIITQGRTYVSLDFFTCFFNDVSAESGVVSISPQMAYLD